MDIEPNSGEVFNTNHSCEKIDPKYWLTKNGEKKLIKELSDNHLENINKMFSDERIKKRNYTEKKMIVKIHKDQLTIDIDDGDEEVKENIIKNTENEFLNDLALSFYDNKYIYFLDKKELTRIMLSANITTKHYDEDWGHFSDEFGPLIGKDLLQVSGIEGHFFWEVLDEVWDILGEQFRSEQAKSWRLPDISELNAMINKGERATIEGFYPNDYWSSTTVLGHEHLVWGVNFGHGCDDWYNKYLDGYVRCVRAKKDGILELSPKFKKLMNWHEATEYAKTLEVDKKDITVVKLNGLHYEKY